MGGDNSNFPQRPKVAYVYALAECQVFSGFGEISKWAAYLGVAFEDRSFSLLAGFCRVVIG